MTIIITKKSDKKLLESIKDKLSKKSEKGNLSKHYGKLKRNIDGLSYQKEIRLSED